MNYLAHIYLSSGIDQVKIGNFIADSVKGKNYAHFPELVQIGIRLHRFIDTYTDQHPTVKVSKRRLHPRYKHYDGVIIDILYDHFLAVNWLDYSTQPLESYVSDFYTILEKNKAILPLKVLNMMPYMISDNWLYNYRTFEGIQNVLIGMNKRTKYVSKMDLAIEDLHKYYQEFKEDFTLFFKDLVKHSSLEYIKMTT
ncbi:acyl carrier protein phosphodiesterase [Flavobacteriaceae bacterium F08102]|nr:acyl carrier protein phosphodiesterase [Flavobacteriaceae bacterium F08102]